MHGVLQAKEREFVYCVFEKYNEEVFERQEVLDSDDLAISYLGRLRTPISQLKRKSEGFDFVMVDETQLFNENERKIFALLTKGTSKHSPIALAIDEAQEPYGQASAGLGILGIDRIENETLPTSHRSTKEIIELAFFVLQKTTDLFSAEFPDYTSIGETMAPNQHPLAEKPSILECSDETRSLGRFVAKRVRDLRSSNVRQIAVVCHADMYWKTLQDELSKNRELPFHVLKQRGENLTADQPLVVLSRPSYIGGQEFDAVIVVGLEQGVAPPLLRESPALSATLEQQVLREMYVSFTRARFRLIVALAPGASPNSFLRAAHDAGLIEWDRSGQRQLTLG
jgi:superfamily I DNA/RNA helicase